MPHRKPVSQISDRAKRYRANSKECRPGAPKQCGFCGSRKNVGVHHINGKEADGDSQNLMWACKSCNQVVGNRLKSSGLGTRTHQYNPPTSRRAQMTEYGQAIKVMRGVFDGDVSAAMQTIRATPASVRSAYTRRSWPVRRQMYGDSGRQGSFDMKNNSPGQFKRCVKAVKRSGSAYDPAAVCAASERKRGLINSKKRKNPLPLALAETIESSALSPYQKKAQAAAAKFQKKIGLKLNRKNPRNPAGAAAAAFEGFHGRPSEQWVEITEQLHEHKYLFGLGELVSMEIISESGVSITVKNFATRDRQLCFLCGNEQRKTRPQMFLVGGDQRVNVSLFGIRQPIHESEVLGLLNRIDYYTIKDHLGKDGGEADYRHKLKKVRIREKPTVTYDTVNEKLYFHGGNYTIEDEGITD